MSRRKEYEHLCDVGRRENFVADVVGLMMIGLGCGLGVGLAQRKGHVCGWDGMGWDGIVVEVLSVSRDAGRCNCSRRMDAPIKAVNV